jgi:hypothetical protein
MMLRVPGSGDVPIPLIVPSDAGNFVKALSQAPPGKNLLAFGDLMTWSDYVKIWSKTTGVPASFEHSTVAVLDKLAPGGYGEEIGEMYAYAQDFGYWGGDPSVIYAKDVSLPMHQCFQCTNASNAPMLPMHQCFQCTNATSYSGLVAPEHSC